MLNAKTLIRVTVLSVWIAACAIAVAQTTDGPSFRTQPSNDNLLLDVYRSTSLSTVFSDLCKKANVACSGVELLEKDSIPPMVVEGKFLTIVRQLAEGANVNIEYAHETPESSPKLTLLRRVPVVPGFEKVGVAGNDPERNADYASEIAPSNPVGLDAGADAVTAGSVTREASTAANVQPAASNSTLPPDVIKMYAGGYATAATPSEFLPFPGSDGQPIPSKPVTAEFLPFPDEFGRPIPVTPAKPGSPFPTLTDQQPK